MSAVWDRLRLFNIGELLTHRGRTVMSLAVMSVSAALLVAVLSISGSVTGSVDKLTRALGGAAVLEISGITDAGFDQQLLPRISATPGVGTAVPMLRAQVGAGEERLMLIGADQTIAALGNRLTGPMAGQALKLATVRNGVLVGPALGHKEGDTFRLGSETVTVAGVLDEESAKQLNGGHIVATQLSLAQKLTGRPGRLDSVQIVAAPGADIATLREALTAAVGGRAVVADPSLRTAQAGGAIQIVRYSTLMSSLAALIVSAFLIYNAMSMAVAQRRPMLSLLRAIGGKRGPMVRDLLVEAALLGVLGGALGAGIGILMGRISIDRVPAGIVQSVEARTEYMVPGYAIPIAVAACVLASVIAAAIAARQVYKVEPIEALVPVGVAQTDNTSRALRIAAIVLGLGLAGGAIALAKADLGRLSLGAISLSYAGAVVLCFAATGPIVRAAAAIARRFGAPGALGATTLERAPRRVWATAMTVMIGVAATVAMGGASRDMVDSASKTFEELGRIDLNVSVTAAEQFPTGPLLPADVKETIAGIPGVADVSPAQMAFATLGSGRVMLQGFRTEEDDINIAAVDRTLLPRLASGEGVIVSRDVARELGVTAGAQVTLPTPTGDHTVRVLQVIPYFTAVAGVVIMDIEHLRTWYERPGETILGVDVADGADPAAVQSAIRAALPPDIRVATGQQQVEAISGSLRQGTALSAAILWIVVLVATVALLNTLMLSVLERRRELGVLRAMGTNRRFLLRSVLAEAVGIGFTGAAIGLAVGVGIQYLAIIAIGHAMTIDPIYDPSILILVYGAGALGLALLGSIPPALRAARMPIVQALAVD
ncbi:FtsX-like permease family protein [Nocardia sp. NPDC050712]|uniref:ABC transporter permease n=1 Tax=Nocardia sp. NPDC050712 TaxID=3155518 RepID=UPI003408EA85